MGKSLCRIEEDSKKLSSKVSPLSDYGLHRTQSGYYYIAHYPPLRAMEELYRNKKRKVLERASRSDFETYLHFPFCETKCTFCHFYKDLASADFVQKQEELVSGIDLEMQMCTSILGQIPARSFYVGGGTPSLMSCDTLQRLLELVEKHMDIQPGAELKFEVFPKEYPSGKIDKMLRLLKDFGFTDIVIDLESGNPESLKRVGRGMSSLEAYLELVDRCISHGFSSIVTGLIIGLPHETKASLEETITTLASIPEVKVVNTFPLITRPPDPIHAQLQKNPEIFHSAKSRDELWIFARKLLKEHGFVEGPISYLHRPEKRPDQQQEKFECVNLLGFGPSGFGYLNGDDWAAQYFNFCNRRDYYDCIDDGEIPIWRAGFLDQAERARRKLIFGLANCKPEPLFDIERRFDVSIDQLLGKELNALHDLGLIKLHPDSGSISYTEKGLCRLEEISYFLGSDYVKDKCDEDIEAESERRRRELMKHHYYIDIGEEDRRKFEEFASTKSSRFTQKLEAPRPELA